MRNIFSFIILMSLSLVIACGGSKKTISDESVEISSAEKYYNKISDSRDTFEMLQMRMNADINSPSYSGSGIITLRMKRDSLIWASVTKFGFEVIRVKLETDSIFILNRLQQEYIAEDIEVMSQLYKGLKLNFNQIQNVLLGKAPIDYVVIPPLRKNNDSLKINGRGINNKGRLTLHFQSPHLKPTSVKGRLSKDYQIDMKNETFEDIGKIYSFPKHREYKFKAGFDFYEFDMNIKQLNIDKSISFPFNVPSGYDRM